MTLFRALDAAGRMVRLGGDRARVWRLRLLGGRGIHPKCLIGAGARIEQPWAVSMGERCVLQSNVWLNLVAEGASVSLGGFTFLGRGTQIEASVRVELGRGCLVGPGVYITDHAHGMDPDAPMFRQPCPGRPVRVGDDVWIGAHAVILDGVTIGEGAVVGAGAVVTRSVEPRTIVGGVPARVIGQRERSVSAYRP